MKYTCEKEKEILRKNGILSPETILNFPKRKNFMKWIKVDRNLNREEFKKQFPLKMPFLCLWKGVVALIEYDEDDDRFYIGIMPGSYLGFWKLDIEREKKITHFMELDMPEDY